MTLRSVLRSVMFRLGEKFGLNARMALAKKINYLNTSKFIKFRKKIATSLDFKSYIDDTYDVYMSDSWATDASGRVKELNALLKKNPLMI